MTERDGGTAGRQRTGDRRTLRPEGGLETPGAGAAVPSRRWHLRFKGLKRFLRFWSLRLVFLPLAVLPPRPARLLGSGLGEVAHWCLPGLRRRARRHLRLAFPDWTEAQVRRVARAVPRWVGRTGADFLHLGARSRTALLARIAAEGREHWEAAASSGRGIVAVTGHFGNWELLGAWLATLGREVTVLYHPFPEGRLDRFVVAQRSRAGVRGLPAERRGAAAIRALRRGGVLGILIDRVPRGTGVADRFFGRECRTAEGPARLALASGAWILPVMLREGRGGYVARFEPPLEVRGEADVEAVSRRLTGILEGWIRESPEQWPWFEDRWKIRSPRERN